ncbi:MAG: acyl-CoA dehydrogenase family protein, partial [Planctomycetes bacterium]|nr:acyl-CoA dehydrogenase family protein [Planctomycetota bacterium]
MSDNEKKELKDNKEVIDTSNMTEGKAAALQMAEAAREQDFSKKSFSKDMFMGKVDLGIMHPFPMQPQEDIDAGKEFLDKFEDILKNQVDPDQIDRDGEIPDEIIAELKAIGALGIKVPTDYDGLGLSQTNYLRAAALMGSRCANITVLLSAHQSIGVSQPLLLYGTDEQKKKFLPRVATNEISAFALTEVNVGSDPAKMETRIEPSDDGENYIINGKKLWCTNGTKAGVIVVMGRTPDREVHGKVRRQVSAFVVEMDSPGITIEHRCRFMGLKSIYNAVLKFDNVKVPKENIIAGEG